MQRTRDTTRLPIVDDDLPDYAVCRITPRETLRAARAGAMGIVF